MFDNSFKAQWREKRRDHWEKSSPLFKRNCRGFASMLKEEWSNFETEMLASSYSLLALEMIVENDTHISEEDLKDAAGLDRAIARLAEYLRKDSLELNCFDSTRDVLVEEIREPFFTILATFTQNIDFTEIARAFLENEVRAGS